MHGAARNMQHPIRNVHDTLALRTCVLGRQPARRASEALCCSATYVETRDTYLAAAQALKLATGPYKASRDAYVAATATYTKSLYE